MQAAHTITDKEYADLCEQLEATKQDADRVSTPLHACAHALVLESLG